MSLIYNIVFQNSFFVQNLIQCKILGEYSLCAANNSNELYWHCHYIWVWGINLIIIYLVCGMLLCVQLVWWRARINSFILYYLRDISGHIRIIVSMAARKNVLFTPYGVVKGVITRGGIVEAITDLL